MDVQNKKWFLGLDVGTNSVGWAATDSEYNLLKFHGNATWGVYLFDEAQTAESRRINRTARRRLERKKQRIDLLQQFFAKEISKYDDKFFIRIKESGLWSDDRTTSNELFVGNLSDRIYNKDYPTIHHLIRDLMVDKSFHDPRLVYMACSYILSHRGHFLLDIGESNIDGVTNFEDIYKDFMGWFESESLSEPWNCSSESFAQVLKSKSSPTVKEKKFYELLFAGKKPEDKYDSLSLKALVGLISNRKTKLSDLFFNETYADLENNSISLSIAEFDDILDMLSSTITPEEFDLLYNAKRLYDWSVLVDILGQEKYISFAKVNTYEQHKKDLKFLKSFVKKYLSKDEYDKIFREIGKEPNYASYSYNAKILGKNTPLPGDYKMCSAEDFCKYIKKYVASASEKVEDADRVQYDDMVSRLDLNTFCPKQMTGNNRVIPYQLYWIELKTILNNASSYLEFLNDKDEYGTVSDKILSLMTFRIPYYVGPLNNHSEYAWVVKKNNQKIYPWNFDDIIDKDQSEESFIRKMTCKCTYLAGEDVLPKNSLLYSKFMVLNEINNLRVNGIKITPELKQKIYENLFKKKRKVSVKDIKNYILANVPLDNSDEFEITGIDEAIKSSLTSYHDFKQYLNDGVLTENDVERIINRITLTTDRSRLFDWLTKEFDLNTDDAKKISKFKYKDFGRLSDKLLTQIMDCDMSTGELRSMDNIIQRMWNTNDNLMMLLSDDYGYKDHVSKCNAEYYETHSLTLDEQLKNMYISNAVKRPILRTLDIVKELTKIEGCPPKKIFVEMARGGTEDQKKKRTKSRRDQIKEFYANFGADDVKALMSELDMKTDDQLRSDKLFLYFMQMGKCMYSGKPINIDDLGNSKLYDIDHIWPQSKIKDNGLDNTVLVDTNYNEQKGDKYPIPEQWRKKMYGYWKSLHDKELISDKKFDRLKRTTPFTDEELASFINRQLVETRQSTKAIADVLKSMYQDTEIVYVKAGLASDFRNTYKDAPHFALKCREVNDFHHARDAYLNVVMGNIYNVQFTKNPINFIKLNGIRNS